MKARLQSTSVRWFLAVSFLVLLAGGLWSAKSAIDRERFETFRIVVSRLGMPGQPADYWTFDSNGSVKFETKVDRRPVQSETRTLSAEAVESIRKALIQLDTLDYEVEGRTNDHVTLVIAIQLDDGEKHRLRLREGARPRFIAAFVDALNANLSDHKIKY